MKKLSSLLFYLLLFHGLFAQGNYPSPIHDSLDSRFFPSGILHNRSPFFFYSSNSSYEANPYDFNGSIPAEKSQLNQWYQLNQDMYFSALKDSIVIEKDSLEQLVLNARQTVEAPIGLSNLFFHRITPGALDSLWLRYDTSSNVLLHLEDTLWLDRANGLYEYYPNPDSLSELAFEEHKLFAGALATPVLYKNKWKFSIDFKLDQQLYISNDKRQASLIEIDFADGQGFRPVSFNQVYSIPYDFSYWDTTSGGSWSPEDYPHPYSEKMLRIRMHYPNEPVLESRMPLTIVPGVPSPDAETKLSTLPMDCPVEADDYRAAEGKVYTLYGNKDRKVQRPVILIEGFDAGLEDYGLLNWNSMSTGLFFDASGNRIYRHLEQLPELFKDLNKANYDLFLVDFKDGKDYIQNNALGVVKLIQHLNRELNEQRSEEQLVVMGASMGGLISRWALRQMEVQNCCHNTRLYATFDTPHQGANIPIGLQYWVKNAADAIGFAVDAVDASYNALKSPGASQLSRYHIEPQSTKLRGDWIKEITELGHPQACYRVALISGSDMALDQPITTTNKEILHCEQTIPAPISFLPGTDWVSVLAPPLLSPMKLIHANAFAEANGTVFEYTDLISTAGSAATAVAIGAFVYASNIVAKGLSYIPYLKPFCEAFIVGSKLFANYALPPLHLVNLISRNIVHTNNAPAGTLNLSEAPGSVTDFPRSVERASFGLARAVWPEPTFVPSTSALDIDTNKLYFNIRNAYNQNKKITPFHTYWANGYDLPEPDSRNQSHVTVNSDNRSWLIQQLENNRAQRIALTTVSPQMPQAGLLQVTYNYGDPIQPYLPSINIASGGELQVNANGTLAYKGSGQSTISGSHYVLATDNPVCDQVRVVVQNGGIFSVGDKGYVNSGEMLFRANSILEVQTGGRLTIYNNSRLLIEEGATLILHPGAIINLNGTDAVLDIAGTVEFKPNAILSYQGNGFIRFSQEMDNIPDASSFWKTSSGNAIVLNGADTTVKKLEVTKNCYIPQNGLDSVRFNNIRVELTEAAKLHVLSTFNSKEVAYYSYDGWGLWVYGQAKCNIENSYFIGGQTGMGASLNILGNSLELKASKFIGQSLKGLYSEEGELDINNGYFSNCYEGWQALNMSNQSTIINTDFTNNTLHGINFIGQGSTSLHITGSLIENSNVGLKAEQVHLSMQCTEVINNINGVVLKKGHIDLSNEAHNTITNNDIGLELIDAIDVKLRNGENHFFANNSYFMYGNLGSNHLLGSPAKLDVFDNNLPPVNGSIPIQAWDHQGVAVSIINYTNTGLNYTWSCGIGMEEPDPFGLVRQPVNTASANNYTNTTTSNQLALISGLSSNTLPQLKIYPNPAKSHTLISLSENEEGITIELRTITGKLVQSYLLYPGERQLTIGLDDLPGGTYLLRLLNIQGVQKTHQLIKL